MEFKVIEGTTEEVEKQINEFNKTHWVHIKGHSGFVFRTNETHMILTIQLIIKD